MSTFCLIATVSPWLWPILAVVAVVLYLGLRSRYDFTITVRGGEVRFRGKLPTHKHRRIAEFFHRDFPSDARITIRGRRGPDGRWNLDIRGRLDRWEKQRVRNYLLVEL